MDVNFENQSKSVRITKILTSFIGLFIGLMLIVPSVFSLTIEDAQLPIKANSFLKLPQERLITKNVNEKMPIILMEIKNSVGNRLNTIESEVTDPNFNIRRNKSMDKGKAATLVWGCIRVAIVAPIATWLLISR